MTDDQIVLNLVWTGEVFGRLSVFTRSLLAHSGARLRFLVNACPPAEVEAMHGFAAEHPGRVVEVWDLSTDRMLRHGDCIDRVVAERDDGGLLAVIDPDILARAPFLPLFTDLLADHDAVTSGRELWSDDNVRPADGLGVSGEHFFDQDGFTFGSPHLAFYRVGPLRETMRRWGVGFSSAGNDLSDETRERLGALGRDFWVYDTGKIVNILLQGDGASLVHVEHPDLLHIGGVSHFLAPPSSAGGPVRWGEGPDWGRHAGQEERWAVASDVAAVLDALLDGRPVPPVPDDCPPARRPRLEAARAALVDAVAAAGPVAAEEARG